jgi:anti-sigma factor RsiW
VTEHVVDDLGAYVLGTLNGDEERDVRVHLESCPACRSELTRVQGATDLLDSARWAEEPPEELEDKILRARPG